MLVASVARWEEHQRMLLSGTEMPGDLSERQELLVTLMESKSLQKDAPEEFQKLEELEEQKSKEALELLGQKHMLET